MVTHRARLRRCTVTGFVLAPLLATVACGSSGDPKQVSTTTIDNAVVAPSQPVPSHTALDATRLRDVESGLNTVTGDKVLQDAGTALRAADEQLRTVGTSAPPNAQRLNDLRTGRPKDCTEIRAVAVRATDVLDDGRAALAASEANVHTVTTSVERLRPVLAQVRTDILALQATVAYATSNSRQELETYETALDAAEVNLTGMQTAADEARTRVQRLTTTFSRLNSARDRALQGC